jgi:protease-4
MWGIMSIRIFRVVMFAMCFLLPLQSMGFSLPTVAAVTEKLKALFSQQQKEEGAGQTVNIALFAIQGLILDETEWVKKIYKIKQDDSIHGVIIKIDSGGGACGASYLLYKEIKALAEKKPVVVIVGNSCCSGAYLASIGANCIIASNMAEIGSIGVIQIISKKKIKKFKDGGASGEINFEVISSSPNKTIFNELGPDLSPEQRNHQQAQIAHFYEMFYRTVAAERRLDSENHMKWADAQVFSGEQALKLRLIDKLGSYSDALAEVLTLVNERVGIEGRPEIIEC